MRLSKVKFSDSICAKALRPAGPVVVPERLQYTERRKNIPYTLLIMMDHTCLTTLFTMFSFNFVYMGK